MRGEILVTKVFSSSNYFPDIDFDQCLKGSNHENKFPDFYSHENKFPDS